MSNLEVNYEYFGVKSPSITYIYECFGNMYEVFGTIFYKYE